MAPETKTADGPTGRPPADGGGAAPGRPLERRVALVTGASGGLGAHFAATLAAHGAEVAACARRLEPMRELAGRAAATGGTIEPFAMDVTDAGSVEAAVAAALERFGRVDVLVNNAGVAPTGPAREMADADFDAALDTNLRGAWLVSRALADPMARAGGGSIVNVASILGLRVAGGVAAYAASKAALVQLTRSLALEWARDRIRVNALAPGYVETDLNRAFFATDAGRAMVRRVPMRRLGRMEELDGPLLLLAGDAGSFMTGSVIACDGGHLVSSL